MNTEAMARSYLEDAAYSMEEAREALERGRYHRAVRRAQEAVELSLKAALRILGIEHPREHDVSEALRDAARARGLPDWFRLELEALMMVSKRLALERGPAFYGDEGAFIPPMQLYGEEDAIRAIRDAEKVFELCNRLFEWWKEKQT